jgi:hypothetical protein
MAKHFVILGFLLITRIPFADAAPRQNKKPGHEDDAEAAQGSDPVLVGAGDVASCDSECKEVGGCDAASPQGRWLKKDLAEHPATCTLAYWHKPLFSSGEKHGDDFEMKPFWKILYAANADVVLGGHDHDYERMTPQDPDGKADASRGIRGFVVGSGGKNSHRTFGPSKPNTESRNETQLVC